MLWQQEFFLLILFYVSLDEKKNLLKFFQLNPKVVDPIFTLRKSKENCERNKKRKPTPQLFFPFTQCKFQFITSMLLHNNIIILLIYTRNNVAEFAHSTLLVAIVIVFLSFQWNRLISLSVVSSFHFLRGLC